MEEVEIQPPTEEKASKMKQKLEAMRKGKQPARVQLDVPAQKEEEDNQRTIQALIQRGRKHKEEEKKPCGQGCSSDPMSLVVVAGIAALAIFTGYKLYTSWFREDSNAALPLLD